jgi:hypothetical protein
VSKEARDADHVGAGRGEGGGGGVQGRSTPSLIDLLAGSIAVSSLMSGGRASARDKGQQMQCRQHSWASTKTASWATNPPFANVSTRALLPRARTDIEALQLRSLDDPPEAF